MGDRSLSQAVGKGRTFDQVVEHVPDMLGWLGEMAAMLRDGGALRLAALDRRFTFDFLRHESTLAELLNAHLLNAVPRCPSTFWTTC